MCAASVRVVHWTALTTKVGCPRCRGPGGFERSKVKAAIETKTCSESRHRK